MALAGRWKHGVAWGLAWARTGLGCGFLAAGALNGSAQTYLFDFGAAGTPASHGESPGDPVLYWNNVPDSIGSSATGELRGLVSADNFSGGIDLVIVTRFNGVNENGTTASPLFSSDATRDSLYGNT